MMKVFCNLNQFPFRFWIIPGSKRDFKVKCYIVYNITPTICFNYYFLEVCVSVLKNIEVIIDTPTNIHLVLNVISIWIMTSDPQVFTFTRGIDKCCDQIVINQNMQLR